MISDQESGVSGQRSLCHLEPLVRGARDGDPVRVLIRPKLVSGNGSHTEECARDSLVKDLLPWIHYTKKEGTGFDYNTGFD